MGEHTFARCRDVWVIDDFTVCFQQDYLKTLLPSVVVVGSVLVLLLSNTLRAVARSRRQHSGYRPLDGSAGTAARLTDVPPDEPLGHQGHENRAGNEDDDDEAAITMRGGRLALAKSTGKGNFVQADTPTTQTASVVLEEVAVLGLVAIYAFRLTRGRAGEMGGAAAAAPAVVGLVSWVYVLILATLRLSLGQTRWRVPRIWNHTACLYGLLWAFHLAVFRSAVAHPRSRLDLILVSVEFGLTTLLFGMAMTTRKGNKTVLLVWEDGLEPSREQLASLLSMLTFTWLEPLMWKGWRTPMELNMVWNLLPREKAAAVLADYRSLKKTTRLSIHLLRHFKGPVFIQAVLAVVCGALSFVPTLLLRAILQYIERPDPPVNVLWLYVILIPITEILRSFADNISLWIGRKMCIKIRAIMVGEIYAKALRRKASAGKDKVLLEEKPKKGKKKNQQQQPDGDAAGAAGAAGAANAANSTPAEDQSFLGRLGQSLGLKQNKKSPNQRDGSDDSDDDENDRKPDAEQAVVALAGDRDGLQGAGAAKDDDGDDDSQTNLGTIINLMSIDSFKIGEVTAYLHVLFATSPTQLVVAVYLLWIVMGVSALPALGVMLLLLPINYGLARGFTSTTKRIQKATDSRINRTNEVLQNIRIIKYFAWEDRFGAIVNEDRRREVRAIRSRYIIWAWAVMLWNSVPVVITFLSFLFYTLIERKPLYPSIAFTAMSLFGLLRVPLDQIGDMVAHVQESVVSIDRVEEFLNEEETEKYDQLGDDNVDETDPQRLRRIIGFRDSTLVWGGRRAAEGADSTAFRLMDLNVEFQIGRLNIISGPTGSGKTSMLMGLLGEMTRLGGRVYCPSGRSREEARPDPETGLANTVAYVAQTAWLINASIRDNILFAAELDEPRYRDVIVACALERDLEILDSGDETLVGEKGISLSGGQKQRICLARALYSNSQHLLLDDCLSAVDSHTAQWIFANCIRGPLMRDRTCILVTHNVQLCVSSADFVVLLDNGRVAGQGTPQELIAAGKLGDDAQRSAPSGSGSDGGGLSGGPSHLPSRVPSSVGDEGPATTAAGAKAMNNDDHNNNNSSSNGSGQTDAAAGKTKTTTGGQKMDAMMETKSTGSVKWPVMKLYLQSMGSWPFWVVTVVVFTLYQASVLATNFWVREWANQYMPQDSAVTADISAPVVFAAAVAPWTLSGGPANVAAAAAAEMAEVPEVNPLYYLAILGLIGVLGALGALLRDLWLFSGSLTASWKIHTRLMESVTRAKFKFFDVTPLGQIMNRFSKDLEAIDQDVAPVAIGVISCAFALLVTIILISVITPGFLAVGIIIMALYGFISAFYLTSSRDLKRIESVQRSPLFQQFGETLMGVTTIRAYGDGRRFVRDNLAQINRQARPYIFLWACNRWLAFRTDMIAGGVSFFAGVFVILGLGRIDAGAAGISLSYAIAFTENLLWLIRLYAANEQNMNSVERVKEYLDVEQEAPAEVAEDRRPARGWPERGEVEFVNYSTRYRPELEPVLRGISLRIKPGEKVGIVGRTGAGKSSLTLALFRALEADEGSILVDGIDVGRIGLRDLREAITVVPQDPTLFQGTIRTNLDPFELHSDEDLFAALRQVQLIDGDDCGPPADLGQDGGDGRGASSPSSSSLPPSSAPAPVEAEDATGSSTPTTATAAIANKNVFLDLSSSVAESGTNLSQGQRQLLCLARAMLRKPRVLVMDEATASIDYATDSRIQQTIRRLKNTTITIAHRLQTIVDYDKVLVLDRGAVVEYGHPYELIRREGGSFRGMCETSGELEALTEAAAKAWGGEGGLVEVQ